VCADYAGLDDYRSMPRLDCWWILFIISVHSHWISNDTHTFRESTPLSKYNTNKKCSNNSWQHVAGIKRPFRCLSGHLEVRGVRSTEV